MKKNTYILRVNTIDGLYADYIVEGINLFQANRNAKKAFFKDYPGADKHITISFGMINQKVITEIMNIIENEGK